LNNHRKISIATPYLKSEWYKWGDGDCIRIRKTGNPDQSRSSDFDYVKTGEMIPTSITCKQNTNSGGCY
jgi:hypothetical protein